MHHTFATVAHINQAGGPYQAIGHPAVSGRERELRALADAVRRVVAATVTHLASPEETASLAAEAEALAGRLEALMPAELPPRFDHAAAEFRGPPITHIRAPFDFVSGICNPTAVPVEMAVDTTVDPPVSRGRAVYSTVYEGPPGCVHGAAIAAAFDMVFTSACSARDASGPTVKLSVRYRRPTLLRVESIYEGWVESFDGHTTITKGHLLQNGQVTAQAEGEFRHLDHEALYRLAQSSTNPDRPEDQAGSS